jgi:hypothetical protein
MTYDGSIGFSNIRIPNENASLLYTYSERNTFPEEVFVHEFLHGLERIEKEYENNVPELHSYEKYGYKDDTVEGLKKWYKDYMLSNISTEKLGLTSKVYTRKPVHESNFTNSIDITSDNFSEPENLIEEIQELLEKIKKYA